VAPDQTGEFEVGLANGDIETAGSLWGARHAIARRAAFAKNPLDPFDILPAKIYKKGSGFGGRMYVETIYNVAELSTIEQ
jgi:hypothetical protein